MTDLSLPRAEYSFLDTSRCAHNGTRACEPCWSEGAVEIDVLVMAPWDITDKVGAPLGSSWERNGDFAYCFVSVSGACDVDNLLRAEGLDAWEVA